MPDRRSVLRAILLGSVGIAAPAGVAVLGGCGVPTGGRPVVDGPGPSVGTGGGSGSGGTPPGPDSATDPADLVKKYLLAVAGQLEDIYRVKLRNSAHSFWARGVEWSPSQEITVVRAIDGPSSSKSGASTRVDITLQPVGQLTSSGVLTPLVPAASQVKCRFEVVNERVDPNGNDVWRIQKIDPPSMASAMLLDSAALDDSPYGLFVPQLVYYWPSAGQNALVPDLRYLPLVGNDQARYIRIVTDLLSDPPGWLTVTEFPPGASLIQAAPDKNNKNLIVNIKLPTPDADHNRLMTQLRASLYPFYQGTLQLQINSEKQQTSSGDGYRTANLADSPRGNADAYCVAGGAVRPLRAETQPPALLGSPLNRDVVWAALSRDKQMIAVVRQIAGRYSLWIGDDKTGSEYIQCSALPAKSTYGRPVWLPGQPAGQEQIVVLVDGQLYAVDRTGTSASNVTPAGVQHIQAFSVAPDGRRIALIVDGVPAVAALTPTDQSAKIGQPQQINIPDVAPGTFAAVAWSRLERVVVAGRLRQADAFTIVEATIDGAIIRQLKDADAVLQITQQITHLAAYPPGPSTHSAGMGWVLGQAGSGKGAYSFQIEQEQVGQLQVEVTPSPSPNASATPKPVELTPTAPFFAD